MFKVFAIQRDMFRRMAEAGDHAPFVRADAHPLAILQPRVGKRARGAPAKGSNCAGCPSARAGRRRQAVALKCGIADGPSTPGSAAAIMRANAELGGAGPERRGEALAQPAGQADVVRVAMGREHAQQGTVGHCTGEQLFPGGPGGSVPAPQSTSAQPCSPSSSAATG
jgi:hypothetical protein